MQKYDFSTHPDGASLPKGEHPTSKGYLREIDDMDKNWPYTNLFSTAKSDGPSVIR